MTDIDPGVTFDPNLFAPSVLFGTCATVLFYFNPHTKSDSYKIVDRLVSLCLFSKYVLQTVIMRHCLRAYELWISLGPCPYICVSPWNNYTVC